MDITIVELKNSLLEKMKDNWKVLLRNKKKLHVTIYSTSNKVSPVCNLNLYSF